MTTHQRTIRYLGDEDPVRELLDNALCLTLISALWGALGVLALGIPAGAAVLTAFFAAVGGMIALGLRRT